MGLKLFRISFCCLFLTVVIKPQQMQKVFPQPQIPFAPKSYICYRTTDSMKIDGKFNEPSWSKVPWTDYFEDIQGNSMPVPRYKTRVKMLWDNNYLYIAAQIQEPNLQASLRQRDTVIFRDNDFEVFMDPDGDTYDYYELEMNALKTAWDLLLLKPYRDAGDNNNVAVNAFDITGLKIGVELLGTLNNPSDVDTGWDLEAALPWNILKECAPNGKPPRAGNQWRINFSRVEWKWNVVNGRYVKNLGSNPNNPHPEDNWVWSPQGLIDMHYPEMWGFIQFSGKLAGSGTDKFIMHKEENGKWALRKVYYNERTYYMNHGKYTNDISKLGLKNYKVSGYIWPPKIELTQNNYEADLKSNDGKETIIITAGGQVLVQH
jgi:Carbohydrate family 9 binding domain-like